MSHPLYRYNDDQISFKSDKAGFNRTMYFPLCGPTSNHLKSSITAYLSGDIKLDKNRYLTKPVSTEDLRQPLRNVYLQIDKNIFSLANPQDDPKTINVEAGPLWHKVVKLDPQSEIAIEALNFMPVSGENAELMRVTITNHSSIVKTMTPTVAIPLFARALENKHDHEHVTSLLNRIKQTEHGVMVSPTMKFDEQGHKPNKDVYFVFGIEDNGQRIKGSFPTVETFCGLVGDFNQPDAVITNKEPEDLHGDDLQGQEAVGALRFYDLTLNPKESKTYFIVIGIAGNEKQAEEVFNRFKFSEQFNHAFTENNAFWLKKTDSIIVDTQNKDFNAWMRWVTIQPVLRRIFGCSFLPDHDYGKGGKGWRDIWQDLLSLILIEPEQVKEALLNNFAGIRMDGSNATIIGSNPGEFIADRNAISRVWMDHGVWPLMTLFLYIHQTGDFDILLADNTYFKDRQLSRNYRRDSAESIDEGNKLKDIHNKIYKGTIIEHLLVQHLVQFFNVGEHNIIRLENADWNDGLDMAFQRGESVAFTCQYAGNMFQLATMLEQLSTRLQVQELSLAKELAILMDTINQPIDYSKVQAKKTLLFDQYFKSVEPKLSGEKISLNIQDIVSDLRKKGQWIFDHIRRQEKITVSNQTWFNGYYDNNGKQVEGQIGKTIRMTLTGQVFAVMSGLAQKDEIKQVIAAAEQFLKDEKLGGYRLNSDFKVPHYLELGRAFGFAFGTKENGAFFSHMIVMYAFALYKQGFAREGYGILQSIFKMAMDTDKSWIYPGIPEYFDSHGRGKYHYLTGSASWLVLTVLNQMFGIAGYNGQLMLAPKLVKEQFGSDGKVSIQCYFAGKRLNITYINLTLKDYGQYKVKEVEFNGRPLTSVQNELSEFLLERSWIEKSADEINLAVKLG
ncbi:MAG: cellobiose phosphorylase [Candidatus Omnitrophica bacterium]|nr:cellobiose phosphorylase [Candidatus Omnitrophota bacterium]